MLDEGAWKMNDKIDQKKQALMLISRIARGKVTDCREMFDGIALYDARGKLRETEGFKEVDTPWGYNSPFMNGAMFESEEHKIRVLVESGYCIGAFTKVTVEPLKTPTQL
jgi:hypothetical protein